MWSDRRLAADMAKGDPRAVARFLDAYGARLHRLARHYSPTDTDAEDLTQEIVLAVYRSIGTYRGSSSLSTWIYRVALNCCLKASSRRRPETVSLMDSFEPDTDWRSDPSACAARNELSEKVRAALDDLGDLHREVVVLHEMHGLTYAECAEVLDIPIGTVKSRLSNALRRLRGCLGSYILGEGAAVSAAGAVGESLP